MAATPDSEPQVWIIKPTRVLSWPEAKRVLWLISLVPASSGFLFLYLGAPLVLPFAGIEVILLWLAFYHVIRTGQWHEIVSITESTVTIEKGYDAPLESYTFDRAWVRVELKAPPYRWYPNRLYLGSHGREVGLAQFLTNGERIELAQSLINAINKTR